MKRGILTAVMLIVGCWATKGALAQDYIEQVAAIQRHFQQQADMHGYEAVQSFRQRTGDNYSSDEAILEYLIAESRRQDPVWFENLQRREADFQAQQAAYTQYANGMLDNSFNNHMLRSQWQHDAHRSYMQGLEQQYQAHEGYIREAIWENGLYHGSNGTVYELPHYSGGNIFQAQDGSTFWQDPSGYYRQYDNGGWAYNMTPYGG